VDLPEHSHATLAVRPECVRLTRGLPRENGSRLNVLKGELVDSIYEGGRRRWAVRIATGQRVIVRDTNSPRDTRPNGDASGARVYLSWDSAKSLVYPHNGAEPH
jgi:hypothetical protein